jgi:hypothetical protein
MMNVAMLRNGPRGRSMGFCARARAIAGLIGALASKHQGSAMRAVFCLLCVVSVWGGSAEPLNSRKPSGEAELRYWLENMVAYHRFTTEEVASATGLRESEVSNALERLGISAGKRPAWRAGDPLVVLPYPGGRHPRIGFLDGAVRPQRETKVSVFTPWDPDSYLVLDVPEAIWSNLGLTYLAHTHIDTIWTRQGITLAPIEWTRLSNGSLSVERTLPNGIRFAAKVLPRADSVRMELELQNGTDETLTDLRVQNCVMLKGAPEFNQLSNENKVLHNPYVACRSPDGRRWVIIAWTPCDRRWANAPVPCLHSDPKFPDCPPGASRRLRGWFSFYEGDDVNGEFRRIDATGWMNE